MNLNGIVLLSAVLNFAAISFGGTLIMILAVTSIVDMVREQTTAAERQLVLEERFRQTSETLKAILDSSPLPIVVTDRHRRVLFWSRAAEQLFVYAAAEVMGQRSPIVPPDQSVEGKALMPRVLAGASIVERETARPEARNLMNLDEVLRLPLDEAILLLRGQNPLRIKKMDYSQHPLASRLVERNINDYLPPLAKEYSDSYQFNPMDTVYMNAATPDTSGHDKRSGCQNYGGRKSGGKQAESARGANPSRSEPFFPKPASWK